MRDFLIISAAVAVGMVAAQLVIFATEALALWVLAR